MHFELFSFSFAFGLYFDIEILRIGGSSLFSFFWIENEDQETQVDFLFFHIK